MRRLEERVSEATLTEPMTLLLLDFECNRCGTKPNLRIFSQTRERYLDADDSESVKTWRCGHCGEVHIITARAYKKAKAPDGKVA